jgi:hypothetical protein
MEDKLKFVVHDKKRWRQICFRRIDIPVILLAKEVIKR